MVYYRSSCTLQQITHQWKFTESLSEAAKEKEDLRVLSEGVGGLSCWWITALKKRDVVIWGMVINEKY